MKKSIILLLTTTLLTACAQPGANTPDATQLSRHSWVLVQVDGAPFNAKEKQQPQIKFTEKMEISGTMCNHFMGQGQLTGDQLQVKSLMATRMLCVDPQLNQLDQMIGAILESGVSIRADNQTLTLKNNQHTLEYRAITQSPAAR